jgi:hypothetical protein
MHDFTDDINLSSINPSNPIPQDDQRVEFDDYEEFRKSAEDFRYY